MRARGERLNHLGFNNGMPTRGSDVADGIVSWGIALAPSPRRGMRADLLAYEIRSPVASGQGEQLQQPMSLGAA